MNQNAVRRNSHGVRSPPGVLPFDEGAGFHVDVIGHTDARPGQCHARAARRNSDRSGKAERVDVLLRSGCNRQGTIRGHIAVLDRGQHPDRAFSINAGDLVQHDGHPQRGTNTGAAHANSRRSRDNGGIDRAFVAGGHGDQTRLLDIAGADSRRGRGAHIVLANRACARDCNTSLTQGNRHRRSRCRRVDRRGRHLQRRSVDLQRESPPRVINQNPALVVAHFAKPDRACGDCVWNCLAGRQAGVQQVDQLRQDQIIRGFVCAIGDHRT